MNAPKLHLTRKILLGLLALLLPAVLAVAPSASRAAPARQADSSPGTYDLSWWSVDGGGGTSSSTGSYSLSGSIGQPDAGAATGGVYTLTGGFESGVEGGVPFSSWIYLPLVFR